MYALITGASSGIGRDMVIELAKRKYDLLVVARRTDRLNALKQGIETKYGVKVTVFSLDLSILENIQKLFDETKMLEIGVLINNAGFGKAGLFEETNLKDDLKMIDLNIKSLHALTKMYLPIMKKGHILNVSSIAAFQPGPRMAPYYASKSYVLSLSRAINYELKKQKRNVYISTLCPGPVKTEFSEVANVDFQMSGMTSKKCAKTAIKKMFSKKEVIVPGIMVNLTMKFSKILPVRLRMAVVYKIQKRKTN